MKVELSCPFDISTADINVDVMKLYRVNVVADVQHLPFINRAFEQVYCFHVLEHVPNPARALKELVRVASRLVELEVPFWLGKNAKANGHVCSFRTKWFHKMLRNMMYCCRVLWEFPRGIFIHVWIYPDVMKNEV